MLHSAVSYRANARCSAIGPRSATGKNVRAPMNTMVANVITPKVMPSVRNVPAVSARGFFAAREPAMASGRMMGMMESKRGQAS